VSQSSSYLNDDQEVKPKEKTIFNVTLEKFDAAAKPKIIKEIKNLIPNMNLMEVWLIFVRYTIYSTLANLPFSPASFRQRSL
jgi:hypothetical protein